MKQLLIAITGLVSVGMIWVIIRMIKGIIKGSLHGDCERGDIEGVKRHLADGADVNAKRKSNDILCDRETPLHIAAFEGHTEIAELLIARGADVHAKDKNDNTPLHTSANMGAKEIAELLISKGVNVKATNEFVRTPLHYASCRGSKEIVELLIAKGADVNAKDEEGDTPLHDAARVGENEIAELLIANGANLNSITEDGQTPLDYLSSEELEGVTAEIAILLRKHGGKTAEELKAEGK